MAETDTKHLILQAIRELQIEGVEVKPSLLSPGTYEVTKTEVLANIPMGAEFKSIITVLKAQVSKA